MTCPTPGCDLPDFHDGDHAPHLHYLDPKAGDDAETCPAILAGAARCPLEEPEPAREQWVETAGNDDCEHDWMVTEDGYTRTWSTTVRTDAAGNITGIRARYGGSEDFSDDGDGEYLRCTKCQATRPMPEGVQVRWV